MKQREAITCEFLVLSMFVPMGHLFIGFVNKVKFAFGIYTLA